MKRLSLLAVWACVAGGTAACGLSDDPREEEKRHEYLVFADPAFAAWLLTATGASRAMKPNGCAGSIVPDAASDRWAK